MDQQLRVGAAVAGGSASLELKVDRLIQMMAGLRGELRSEVAGLRGELRSEVAGLRGEVAGLRGELHDQEVCFKASLQEVRNEAARLTKDVLQRLTKLEARCEGGTARADTDEYDEYDEMVRAGLDYTSYPQYCTGPCMNEL
jgi:hypothetical protein